MEQENIHIVRTLFENINARNLDASDRFIAPDYQGYTPGSPMPQDRARIKAFLEANINAFPDIHFEIKDIIAQGDKVAVTWEWTGTHTATYVGLDGQTIPATNKSVKTRATTIYEFSEGLLVRQESFFDQLDLFQQLGLAPSAQARP